LEIRDTVIQPLRSQADCRYSKVMGPLGSSERRSSSKSGDFLRVVDACVFRAGR
jgi:hypothetical protein